MKIRIKTELIEIEIEDNPTIDNEGFTKRVLPTLPECIEEAISAAIKLHSEVRGEE